MNITREEKQAIIHVVNHYLEEARIDCEDYLSTVDDEDFGNMSDKALYDYCVNNGIVNIWTSIYELSKIK